MIKVNSREDYLREVANLLPDECIAAEIGVYKGDFAQSILTILNPKHLLLVDPYEENKSYYSYELAGLSTAYSTNDDYENVMKRFEIEIATNQVAFDRRFSYHAVVDYPDGLFNFIYIDASHLFKDVQRDTNDWLQKLKRGGIMAGHDHIQFNGFGVIQAVDEFCKEHNFEMIILNENGGDFALKIK